MTLPRAISIVSLAVWGTIAANASQAATDTPVETADTTLILSDVTVTAIKQTADLSLQPLSATVLTSGQIEKWHVNAIKNISEIAPNFYMPSYGSRLTSSIYVRGIGSRLDQPAVGLTVDNVPYLSKDSYDFDVLDIERVEVLRGPQSTLYGRNTMGGQINVYTLQPLNYQGSRVMATVGNGPEARLGISHYRKFSPSLAMSFSGSFSFFDGFYRNHYNTYKTDTEKGGTLRWKTQWQPREALMLENVASFNMYRQSGYPYQYAGSGMVNYNDTCFYRRNAVADGLTIKYNTGSVSIAGITSLQYVDDNMTLDQDFLPLNYFTLTQRKHEFNITQDVVVRGSNGFFKWMGGLFGFYKHTSMWAPVQLKEDMIDRMIVGPVNNNPAIPVSLQCNYPSILLDSHFRQPVWGTAVYLQTDFDLGRVNIALGQRLDYEHTSLNYNSVCATSFSAYMKSGIPPTPILTKELDVDLTGKLSDHFLQYVPKLTVSCDLDMRSRSSIYASVAKGYKSGGFNTQMFSTILQAHLEADLKGAMPGGASRPSELPDIRQTVAYLPETSWNYELGAHIFCADGRVVTDLSLFYIDCRNQQITIFPDAGTTGRITTNAGRTRSYGAEVQISYKPTLQWAFTANYGYTNATFLRYRDGAVSYRGNHVPYAPVHTAFASASYTHSLPRDWKLTYTLDCRCAGRIYWNEENSLSQPLYALLGGSVTANHGWISLEAWITNITNHKYNTFYFSSMGNDFLQQANPRRFGVTLRVNM